MTNFADRNKMMRTIRKIGSILLVSLLLSTTGGFSIYRNFCYCLGDSSASIFMNAPCEHDNSSEEASYCSLENTNSCCMEKPVQVSKTNCKNDHCCQTSSQFLKISDSFQPGMGKISLNPFAAVAAILFFYFPIDKNINSSLNLYNADLPPPDSGRQILVAHHQLKIAPSLV